MNLYKIREAKTEAGDFFRGVQKQRPEQYQGIYVVSPSGTVLSSQGRQPEKKSWTKDLLDVLDEGIKAYGDVTPRKITWRDPQPFRGVGVRPDKSIVLAVWTRYMLRGTDRNGMGSPAFDSVELSSTLADSLTLADVPKGTTWQVPAGLVKRLHVVLSPTSDQTNLARANEVGVATLKGKVERIRDGIAYLSFEGKIAGEHAGVFEPNKGKKTRAEMTLTGVGTCVAKSGKLLSFTLVGDGTFRSFPPYDSPQRYGAVVEWVRKK